MQQRIFYYQINKLEYSIGNPFNKSVVEYFHTLCFLIAQQFLYITSLKGKFSTCMHCCTSLYWQSSKVAQLYHSNEWSLKVNIFMEILVMLFNYNVTRCYICTIHTLFSDSYITGYTQWYTDDFFVIFRNKRHSYPNFEFYLSRCWGHGRKPSLLHVYFRRGGVFLKSAISSIRSLYLLATFNWQTTKYTWLIDMFWSY
jgi:hypothetical protein